MAEVQIPWFEIPVTDMERASAFYARVLAASLAPMDSPSGKIMVFMNGDNPAGALAQKTTPSRDGVLIYFSSPDIEATLKQVSAAGGEILMPKTSIGAHGHIAQFADTEGNRIALHSI